MSNSNIPQTATINTDVNGSLNLDLHAAGVLKLGGQKRVAVHGSDQKVPATVIAGTNRSDVYAQAATNVAKSLAGKTRLRHNFAAGIFATVGIAGTAVVAWKAGLVVGALLGSSLGPVGTIAGAVVGALVTAVGASWIKNRGEARSKSFTPTSPAVLALVNRLNPRIGPDYRAHVDASTKTIVSAMARIKGVKPDQIDRGYVESALLLFLEVQMTRFGSFYSADEAKTDLNIFGKKLVSQFRKLHENSRDASPEALGARSEDLFQQLQHQIRGYLEKSQQPCDSVELEQMQLKLCETHSQLKDVEMRRGYNCPNLIKMLRFENERYSRLNPIEDVPELDPNYGLGKIYSRAKRRAENQVDARAFNYRDIHLTDVPDTQLELCRSTLRNPPANLEERLEEKATDQDRWWTQREYVKFRAIDSANVIIQAMDNGAAQAGK